MSNRRIWVLSTTRADYGLLYWLLREIDDDPELELMLAVSGSHLSTEFGETVREIERDGFRIHRRLEVLLSSDSRTAMVKAMGLTMLSCAESLAEDRPDLLVLLGDRFEIVPVALAAVAHGIPLVHLHGGETSRGALDEYFRHAVTKLANIHFPATEVYRRRIIQMGEDPAWVFNYGAPGLDHLHRSEPVSRDALQELLGISLDRPTAIATFHPATSDMTTGCRPQVANLLEALEACDDLQVVFSKANADTQGRDINQALARWCADHPDRSRLFDNLGPLVYQGCLRHLDLMLGNSSSGLVEAPSFGLPVVNIGSRQEGRLAAGNVISVDNRVDEIRRGIDLALSPEFRAQLIHLQNPYDRYGDGRTSRRIKETLKVVPLDTGVTKKGFIDAVMAAGNE